MGTIVEESAPELKVGHDALWGWFGLSYASWLVLPRIMLHEMPDDWQRRMADLLNEWNAAWCSEDLPIPSVVAKDGGKFSKWPNWLLNYRHPDRGQINKMRSNISSKGTEKTVFAAKQRLQEELK